MSYVDGFVLVGAEEEGRGLQEDGDQAGKVWREHGALDYRECVGDDLKAKMGVLRSRKLAKAKPGETVVFSWIVYKSRAHRDKRQEGHERPAPARDDGPERDAVRHEAHGLRRVQESRRLLTGRVTSGA